MSLELINKLQNLQAPVATGSNNIQNRNWIDKTVAGPMASHLVAMPSQVFLCESWHNCLSKVLSCNQQSVWSSDPHLQGTWAGDTHSVSIVKQSGITGPTKHCSPTTDKRFMILSRRGEKRREDMGLICQVIWVTKSKMWIFVTYFLWFRVIILPLMKIQNSFSESVVSICGIHQYQKGTVLK